MTESIYMQLGRIVATLEAFREDLSDLRESHKAAAEERRKGNHDLRNAQQAVALRMDAMERRAAEQHKANTDRLDSLAKDISGMRDPVEQFVSIRKRAASVVVILVSVVGVLWTLSEPLYTLFVTRLLGMGRP